MPVGSTSYFGVGFVSSDEFRQRVAEAREKADLVDIVGQTVKLGRGGKPRGQCPFHGSKSDSFAVDPDRGRARCWGCGWSGDAIRFVQDMFNLNFIDALREVEAAAGIRPDDGRSDRVVNPVRRRKSDQPARKVAVIEPIDYGRWLWRHARPNADAVRAYFLGRGVPAAFLDDLAPAFYANVLFLPLAPIAAWKLGDGKRCGPGSVPQAPALVSLVRGAPGGQNPPWQAQGVHVTFLRPDLGGKMERQRADGSDYPARKMLGSMSGGCVFFPGVGSSADALAVCAPLYVGEGLETVLSGMALQGAPAGACGLAALSLDTLQGPEMLVRHARPLFDPEPDWSRGRGLSFPHSGPVTVLVDADMKPLRGPIDQRTGEHLGEPVIEVRRGPVVRRLITGAERAAICAALAVKSWRASGVEARAVRPRMGQDFNDAARETAE